MSWVISTISLLGIWILRLSFQLLFPHLRMMEGTDDFDVETWVQSVGTDTSGSFSSPRKCERSHGAKVSSTGTGAIVQKFKRATPPPESNGISEGGHGENIPASAWKISAVLCGAILLDLKWGSIMDQGQVTVLREDSGAWNGMR